MADAEDIKALAALGCTAEPVGSRVTCDPAPTDTDEDFLVVVPSTDKSVTDVVSKLTERGFVWEGDHSRHYQDIAASDFMSWRKGAVNFIVTSSGAFATRWRAATHVAKRLNLLDKADRIALFQAVLYGNQWEKSGD